MINKIWLTNLALVFALSGYAQDEILGGWATPEGNMIVEIYKAQEGLYAGKVAWLKKPTDKKGNPHKDRMNPDKQLQDRNILGMDMLENLKYTDGKWYGTLYTPKKGRKVDAELNLNKDEKLDINVSFMGFSKTVQWIRTELPK